MSIPIALQAKLNERTWNATKRTQPRAPKVPDNIFILARDSLDEGAFTQARVHLEGQEHLKSDHDALNLEGLALLGEKNYEAAETAFTQAITLARHRISFFWSNLSVLKKEQGNLDEALIAAYESKREWPEWAGGWINAISVHCARMDRNALEREVEDMKLAWPGWMKDSLLRERIRQDVTLSWLRETASLRALFPDWLSN